MNSKGQIVFFIIAVVVIIFGLLIYFNVTGETDDTKAELKPMLESYDKSKLDGIRYYVTTCLEREAKNALKKLGEEGRLFNEDPETTPPLKKILPESFVFEYQVNEDPTKKEYKTYYGIRKPTFTGAIAALPDFPYKIYPRNPDYMSEILRSFGLAFFGKSALLGLCDSESNYYNLGSCDNTVAGFMSIQKQLEEEIKNEIFKKDGTGNDAGCLKFDKLNFIQVENDPDFDEKITVRSLIGQTDVRFELEFPLKFKYQDGDTKYTEELRFATKLPVRLQKVWRLADSIVNNENQNILYDPTDSSIIKEEGFDVKVLKSPCSQNCRHDVIDDDVIVITDRYSVVDGKPYVFKIARDNRLPALDYIKTTSEEIEYDVVAEEGDTLELEFKAFDPDEDDIHFFFDGWKETTDMKFTKATCDEFPPVKLRPGNSLTSCFTALSAPIDGSKLSDKFEKKDKNTFGVKTSLTEEEKFLTQEDIGEHVLTVIACDDEGKRIHEADTNNPKKEYKQNCDYQDVKILVKDLPKVEIIGWHLYGKPSKLNYLKNNNIASIEDPYTLQFKYDCFYCPDTLNFNWKFSAPGGEPYVDIKKEYTYPKNAAKQIDIDNIDIKQFKLDVPEKDVNGKHDLNKMRIDPGDKEKPFFQNAGDEVWVEYFDGYKRNKLKFEDLVVVDCFPFRGTKKPVYPIKLKSSDSLPSADSLEAFMRDHSCCKANGVEIKKDNNEFTQAQLESFKTKWVVRTGESCFEGSKFYGGVALGEASPNDNDIYSVSADSCTNGNLCSADLNKNKEKTCAILQSDEDERCSGPQSKDAQDTKECFSYPSGQSFEKTILENSGADGYCSNSKIFGKLRCKAQCSEGTCSHVGDVKSDDFDCKCVSGDSDCNDVRPGQPSKSTGFECNSNCDKVSSSTPII